VAGSLARHHPESSTRTHPVSATSSSNWNCVKRWNYKEECPQRLNLQAHTDRERKTERERERM